MAPPSGTLRVGRYFLALVVLFGVLYATVFFPGNRHTPKLGIDLVGGQRVIFTAISPKGAPSPTPDQMTQARQILEDRINGTGVTGATVVVQSSDQLVVEIPGGTGADVAKLGQAAVLNFRGVVAPAAQVTCGAAAPKPTGTASSSATPSTSTSSSAPATRPSSSAKGSTSAKAAPNDARDRPLAAATTSTAAKQPAAKTTAAAKSTAAAKTTPVTSGSATASASAPATTAPATKCSATSISGLKFTIPTTEKAYTALTAAQKAQITAGLASFRCNAAQTELDKASSYYVACDDGKTYGAKVAYLLGKVIVPGKNIDSASAVAPSSSGQGSADWTVELKLNGPGTDSWSAWTGANNTNSSTTSGSVLQCGTGSGQAFPCSDWVGFTLDGQVLSAPQTQSAIGSTTQITGNFDQTSSNNLAKQLNYGKLPLSFKIESNESVSATLGTSQLQAAFLAGGIGLILVIIYSLLYYRGLGLVTIASLLVSGGITYAMLVILGEHLGFTLDLSGIAGFIVALGITADSFVVFFERIKDEVHEGRSVRVAVPRAWVRARRTVLSADTVSFLAAAILYYFASADVKGFAFTLGLSTILDLVVVFLFTHPIVSLLSRSRAFGSPRFTGLNAVRVGGFEIDDDEPKGRRTAAGRAAERRGGTGKPKRAARSATVVLDKDEPDDVEPVDIDELDDDDLDDDVVGGADEVATPADDAGDELDPPRRRTTPAGGTAAERAAARRARLRGQTPPDEEGTS